MAPYVHAVAGHLTQSELDAARPVISNIGSGMMTADQEKTVLRELSKVTNPARASAIRTYIRNSHVSQKGGHARLMLTVRWDHGATIQPSTQTVWAKMFTLPKPSDVGRVRRPQGRDRRIISIIWGRGRTFSSRSDASCTGGPLSHCPGETRLWELPLTRAVHMDDNSFQDWPSLLQWASGCNEPHRGPWEPSRRISDPRMLQTSLWFTRTEAEYCSPCFRIRSDDDAEAPCAEKRCWPHPPLIGDDWGRRPVATM